MDISLLGPLEVKINGTRCVPTAPKVRTVLAILSTHAGQMVPVSTLIHELWEHNPPASSLTTMQTYILNLRKMLVGATGQSTKAVSHELLITRPGGYQLRIDQFNLDIVQYHDLVNSGNSAVAVGDLRLGMRMYQDAVSLWRGSALIDIQTGRLLESKRLQLEESRLLTQEHLIEAQIELGDYREALTELVTLSGDHPLHEGLHLLYIRALHRAGRRAQALAVYHRLRNNLVSELGLEPGQQVQAAHRALLQPEPSITC